MAAISDSGVLILHSAIARPDLLHSVFGDVFVPGAVWREVVDQGRNRPGAAEIADVSWIRRTTRGDARLPETSGLGAWEAAVIGETVAADGATPVLLDDRGARSVAASLGLTVFGSAGVLLLAKNLDLVPAIAPPLLGLTEVGLFVGKTTVDQLLAAANEAN
ncbi:MAG: hypothetical protein ACR2OO_08760 [Thermomicrobiales bacterium]